MAKLLPIILLVVGIAIGGGAGVFLAPAPEAPCEGEDCPKEETKEKEDAKEEEEETPDQPVQFIAMKNQFVVPVVRDDRVVSLVVMSISLEVREGTSEVIFLREPKLRDSFLKVLFDHAAIGGFDGPFTESERLSVLRVALLEAAQNDIGKDVSDILITDIVRQEM